MRVVNGTAADATGIANEDIGAGASAKQAGKVLRPHKEASVPIHMGLADEISRNVSNELRLGGVRPPLVLGQPAIWAPIARR